MTTPIHFAARIDTSAEWKYFALCGYSGKDPDEFSNHEGKIKKSLGGCVTCAECIKRMGVKPT